MTGITEVSPGVMMLGREPKILKVADASTRQWRNGSGVTRGLYSHMPSIRTDPVWTLSLAELTEAADFSTFAGYDRHFMIAGRAGVELDIDGRPRPVAYTDVARFAGEANVRVSLPYGPSTALNLMVRRSDHQGDLTYRRINGDRVVDPRRVTALVVLSGALRVFGSNIHTPGDTVVIGDKPIVVSGHSAVVARLRIERTSENGHGQNTSLIPPDERTLR